MTSPLGEAHERVRLQPRLPPSVHDRAATASARVAFLASGTALTSARDEVGSRAHDAAPRRRWEPTTRGPNARRQSATVRATRCHGMPSASVTSVRYESAWCDATARCAPPPLRRRRQLGQVDSRQLVRGEGVSPYSAAAERWLSAKPRHRCRSSAARAAADVALAVLRFRWHGCDAYTPGRSRTRWPRRTSPASRKSLTPRASAWRAGERPRAGPAGCIRSTRRCAPTCPATRTTACGRRGDPDRPCAQPASPLPTPMLCQFRGI